MSESPLGINLYHLGQFASLQSSNQYWSVAGAELKRKPTADERRASIYIRRASRVHVLGRQASYNYLDVERMLDLLHLAWSSNVVGSTFTLRAMRFLLDSLCHDKASCAYHYCSDMYALMQRSARRKVRPARFN